MRNLRQRVRRLIMNRLTEQIVGNPIVTRALRRKYSHFDMIFTDVWKEYLQSHSADISDKLGILCDGMDGISKELAAVVADRYFRMAPACKFNETVLYSAERLFTNYEQKLQTEFEQLMYLRERRGYWLPEPYRSLSISVFAPHNGLDFIPDARQRLSGFPVIDGGAFIGDSALAINEFGPRSIHCFEPDDKNRRYLHETVAHNALDNVTIVNAGLGSVEGRARVCSNASQTTLMPDDAGVPVVTIDAYCMANDIAPALIKLDVEGMEYDTIQGGLETIKQHAPLLIISIYHTPRDFFEIKPILQNLDLGYQFAIRRLDPFHPTNETVLLCYR